MKAGWMEKRKRTRERKSKVGWEMSGDFYVLQNQFVPVYPFSSSSHQPRALTRHCNTRRLRRESTTPTTQNPPDFPHSIHHLLSSSPLSHSLLSDVSHPIFPLQPRFHVFLSEFIRLPRPSYCCHIRLLSVLSFISSRALLLHSPTPVPSFTPSNFVSVPFLFYPQLFSPPYCLLSIIYCPL